MNSQVLYLTALNIAGRGLNFLLYLLIANKFGAGQDTDWFFFVYSITYFIIGIFVQSVESVLVPFLHKVEDRSISSCLKHTFVIGSYATIPVVIISLISGLWVAPKLGFTAPDSWQLTLFICISLGVQPLLALVSSFFSSWLQFKQLFSLPTIHLSLRSLGIIPFLLLPFCDTIFRLSLAFLIGEILRMVILGVYSRKTILHVSRSQKTNIPIKLPSISKEICWMSFALTISFVNIAVDLAMVGGLSSGSATLVDYAGRLRGFPVLLFGGIMTMLLGKWSHQHLQQKVSLEFKQVNKIFITVLLSAVVVVGCLLFYLDSIVSIIFFSEQFTPSNLYNLEDLLFWYLLGVPMLAGYFILSKAFLVLRKIKILAKISLVLCGLNYIFNLIFLKLLGLKGVALSTSLLDVIACLLAFFLLKNIMRRSSENTFS